MINDEVKSDEGSNLRYVSILATTHEENDCSMVAMNAEVSDALYEVVKVDSGFTSTVSTDLLSYQIMPQGYPTRTTPSLNENQYNLGLVELKEVTYVACNTKIKNVANISFNANKKEYKHIYYEDVSPNYRFVTGGVEYDG